MCSGHIPSKLLYIHLGLFWPEKKSGKIRIAERSIHNRNPETQGVKSDVSDEPMKTYKYDKSMIVVKQLACRTGERQGIQVAPSPVRLVNGEEIVVIHHSNPSLRNQGSYNLEFLLWRLILKSLENCNH